jgi:hypothetical protein
MNELDALRQEAETLKNAIRVSIHYYYHYRTYAMSCIFYRKSKQSAY